MPERTAPNPSRPSISLPCEIVNVGRWICLTQEAPRRLSPAREIAKFCCQPLISSAGWTCQLDDICGVEATVLLRKLAANGPIGHGTPLNGYGVVTIARPVDADASEMPPAFVRCEKPIAVIRDTAAAARVPEWQ